jgi:hypothetical protein
MRLVINACRTQQMECFSALHLAARTRVSFGRDSKAPELLSIASLFADLIGSYRCCRPGFDHSARELVAPSFRFSYQSPLPRLLARHRGGRSGSPSRPDAVTCISSDPAQHMSDSREPAMGGIDYPLTHRQGARHFRSRPRRSSVSRRRPLPRRNGVEGRVSAPSAPVSLPEHG